MGAHKGIRGTCFDASSAGAAPIGRRQIGLKFQGRQDHSEKQPGSHLPVDDAGIFPNPTYTRVLGVNTFDQRPGVDIAHGSKLVRWSASRNIHAFDVTISCRPAFNGKRSKLRLNYAELTQYGVVIILAAPRIARNPATIRIAARSRVRFSRVVVDRADHHAACPRRHMLQRSALQPAFGVTRLQVLHVTCVTLRDPLRIMLEFLARPDAGYSSQLESGVQCSRFYSIRDVGESRHYQT